MSGESQPLLLSPGLPFARLAVTLARLGYSLDPDPTAPDPVLPDEPELASWSRDGAARVVAAFEPAVGLRTLTFSGPAGASVRTALEHALPTFEAHEIAELLAGPGPEGMLLGLVAARELGDASLLARAVELSSHPDSAVAGEAARAVAAIAAPLGAVATEHLRTERARRPGRSVLFSSVRDPRERRQIVRWLSHDRPAAGEPVLEVLRSALEDPDWEVRTSAMLAVARLPAPSLKGAVRRVALPTGGREGLDSIDRDFLVAAREIVVGRLDGRPLPSPALAHLERCVLGAPVERHDRAFLLIHALATPLPARMAPAVLPPGVGENDSDYRLGGDGPELVWVPPVPHWLGDDPAVSESGGPIRRVHSRGGFFIAERACSTSAQAEPTTCSVRDAEAMCRRLSERSGARVGLPTADEWQMASRGPDARRFPWGVGLDDDGLGVPSPWGLRATVGAPAEWTATRNGPGSRIVCGGLRTLRCSARHEIGEADGLAAIRPLVRA